MNSIYLVLFAFICFFLGYKFYSRFLSSKIFELDDSEGQLDILSNGFKLRGNWNINNVAATYVFAAFAETPFKYANAR